MPDNLTNPSTSDPHPMEVGPVSATVLPPAISASGQAALSAAKDYAHQALSKATLRAYQSDWAHFSAWCADAGYMPLPAEPVGVAAYLAAHAKMHSRATLRRRLAAIGQMHQLHGHDWRPSHPAIRTTLRGMLRKHGTPTRRSAAIGTAEIRKLLACCGDDLTGLRDRALLLLGYAAALRRAELATIEREHLVFDGGGLRLLIPRGKSDQDGEGAWIGIPKGERRDTCPVRTLEAWLTASACRYGPVFRGIDRWGRLSATALHPDAIRQILRIRAKAAGLTVSVAERLSPHGLRAGFVTEAYKAGARDEQIMEHTRHRDLKTMRGYVRRAKLGLESPARLLGL